MDRRVDAVEPRREGAEEEFEGWLFLTLLRINCHRKNIASSVKVSEKSLGVS